MSLGLRRVVMSVVCFVIAVLAARASGWPYGLIAVGVGAAGGLAFFGVALRGVAIPQSGVGDAWKNPATRAGALAGAGLTPILAGIAVAIAPNGEAVLVSGLCAALGALALALRVWGRDTSSRT
jgi:hypothetical protein